MSETHHADFYARREQQARVLADKASQPGVRSIHLGMAAEYAAKARDPQRRPTLRIAHDQE